MRTRSMSDLLTQADRNSPLEPSCCWKVQEDFSVILAMNHERFAGC